MINKVVITKGAQKDVRNAPMQVARNLKTWTELVKTEGLEQVRKILGYHDEPLKGKRSGQRSIRLNIAWRAFYTIEKDECGSNVVKFVSVFEVTKHEY
jgi:toxin HigB-1